MKKITCLFVLSSFLLLMTQCNKEEEATGTDKDLFDEATVTSGFTFYKNNPIVWLSSQQSGHKPYMRVKFNAVAQAALDSTGKLPVGGSFPDGSLIVKELYDSPNGAIRLLAIMKKSSTDPNAGQGWLWGEYGADGSVAFSVEKKGSGCISCHGQGDSRDYTRVFGLFP